MAFDRIFSFTDKLLERALDGLTQRQRITAHNIANVNTPGYKSLRLSFESVLAEAVRNQSPGISGTRTHPQHIAFPDRSAHIPHRFPVYPERSTTMRNDGNNVDIERERAQLLKDEVHYSAIVQQIEKRFAMLKDVIREGRR